MPGSRFHRDRFRPPLRKAPTGGWRTGVKVERSFCRKSRQSGRSLPVSLSFLLSMRRCQPLAAFQAPNAGLAAKVRHCSRAQFLPWPESKRWPPAEKGFQPCHAECCEGFEPFVFDPRRRCFSHLRDHDDSLGFFRPLLAYVVRPSGEMAPISQTSIETSLALPPRASRPTPRLSARMG